jgi:hypothetical protein
MPPIPAKVATRFTSQLKRFQGIIDGARLRDVNEFDTALIITALTKLMMRAKFHA